MTELTLFASSFLVVLLLGLQSLNVNNGHFILAALTSFGIGSMQMVMFKLAPHATWTEIDAASELDSLSGRFRDRIDEHDLEQIKATVARVYDASEQLQPLPEAAPCA